MIVGEVDGEYRILSTSIVNLFSRRYYVIRRNGRDGGSLYLTISWPLVSAMFYFDFEFLQIRYRSSSDYKIIACRIQI